MAPTLASSIAEQLVRYGVRRVFGLCGGHVQPIWDALDRLGVEVVGVRHEMSAVLMAQAHAELGGGLGVALVTAGPGLTNAITGIANADAGRSPVLVVSGRPPRPQAGRGALQEMPQAALIRPLTRAAVTVAGRDEVSEGLARAVAGALGAAGDRGPAYVDFPTDLLREPPLPAPAVTGLPWPAPLAPEPGAVEAAGGLLRAARRVLVVTGRPATVEPALVERFLDLVGGVHLETVESRGLLPSGHPASAPAVRARAMAEADLVVTLGRRLDFQLAYGSPAVFAAARAFIRCGRPDSELSGNREPEVALRGDVPDVLRALLALGVAPAAPDLAWRDRLRGESEARAARLAAELARPPATSDGRLHPYALLAAVQEVLDAVPGAVAIADGGDILSFARVALRAPAWLDCGPFGCLGVGVPFGVAAALLHPDRRVVAVAGDGAFGITAMEVETAVRAGARLLCVVADNAGWNIERHDQRETYGNLVAVDLGGRYEELGRALGAHGERVTAARDLRPALARALERLPAVVAVEVSGEPVSPDGRSGLAGVPDRQPLALWDAAEKRLGTEPAATPTPPSPLAGEGGVASAAPSPLEGEGGVGGGGEHNEERKEDGARSGAVVQPAPRIAEGAAGACMPTSERPVRWPCRARDARVVAMPAV